MLAAREDLPLPPPAARRGGASAAGATAPPRAPRSCAFGGWWPRERPPSVLALAIARRQRALLTRRVSLLPLQDTEFPGVVARPIGQFTGNADYHYQTLRCNCDLLKIIQLGLTFTDETGTPCPECCTFQFNFKFSLNSDMYAQDSIDLLQRSGIDFEQFEARGIDPFLFGELLMTSGLVLNENVKWLSFHSGYDFGYMLHLLRCEEMPAEEDDFFELLGLFFPYIYDIKYIVKYCESLPGAENLKGGLNRVGEALQVERIGPAHQAGSDSLITSSTFFRVDEVFSPQLESHGMPTLEAATNGVIYGLGAGGRHEGVPESPMDNTGGGSQSSQ